MQDLNLRPLACEASLSPYERESPIFVGDLPSASVKKLSALVDWKHTVDAFLWRCQLRALSQNTVQLYAIVFNLLERFHEAEGLTCPSPQTCPPEHLQRFVWWCLRRVKPVSAHAYWRTLRTFFRWLVKEGLRADNPIEKVPEPKMHQPLPRTVTEEHFAKALSTLNLNTFVGLRDAALFCLAFDSGARLSELLGLRVGDVDLRGQFAKVQGKGGRERLIYFGRQTAMLLLRYLTQRTFLLGQPSSDAYLFVCADGRPMTRRRALTRWHLAQKRAGLTVLPFHGLRHGFARAWLLRNGDAISLRRLLGHATVQMTERYVTLWGHDLQRLHRERSPVDSIGLQVKGAK